MIYGSTAASESDAKAAAAASPSGTARADAPRLQSRRARTLLAAALAGAMAATALAFSAPVTLADGPDFVTQQERRDVVVVHVGQAHVLHLPRDARDVVVSDPTVVDAVLRTARQPVLFGMKIGQANVLFFDGGNREIRSIQIRVEYDTAILNSMIQQQFPGVDVGAESVLGDIVLTGSVSNSPQSAAIEAFAQRFIRSSRLSHGGDDAEDAGVINRVAITNDEQIHLRVRVAEVDRTVLKRLGLDWNAALNSSSLSSAITIQRLPFTDFLRASEANINTLVQPLDTFLNILEQYTLVRTLAEPSLTAVTGETASFLAGGEFPIPVSLDDGQLGIEFKQFGVGLDFTPVIVGEGRISLQIATEVSDISDENNVTVAGLEIPAITIRRAETTVEVGSGGTIMIAGLIQQSTRRLSTGLPGLRSLPVIGAFFRAEENEFQDTELVILVTPYFAKQNSMDAFATPLDGFSPASDLDVYLFGRLHAVYGSGDPSDPEIRQQASELRAPVGFMME